MEKLPINTTDFIELDQLMSFILDKYSAVIANHYTNSPSLIEVVESISGYYKNIINCMPGNVYWLDKNAVGVGCNQNVLKMFGFTSQDQFRGLTFEEMAEAGHWLPETMNSFKQDSLSVINTGQAKLNVEEPPIPHSDGSVIYFLTSRVPLFDQNSEIIGMVGISIDITERKYAERSLRIAKEKAEAANRAKSIFLANISHDIKTPIAGIISASEHLAYSLSNPENKQRANSIFQAGARLLELMSELIEFSRTEITPTATQVDKVILDTLITNVIQLMRPTLDEKQLALTLAYDSTIPAVLVGNHFYVYRILLNLIANAITFTPQGSIGVTADLIEETAEQALIAIKVSDTGIGIPEDKYAAIFDRFTRLTPSYQGVYKGNGLGLAIVKQYIEEIGGKINLVSKEGEGSTFTCIIPFKKTTELPNALTQILPQPQFSKNNIRSSETIKILLVEDSLIAAQAIKDIFASLDCHVDVAETGQEALQLFSINKYSVICMDLGLPDIDGFSVTKKIRNIEFKAKAINIPILALSAHIDEDIRHECYLAGMNETLSKPLLRAHAEQILHNIVLPADS